MRNMKREEILGLLAVLVPGSVWAGIDLWKISDEYCQATPDAYGDTSAENTFPGDKIVAA